MPVTRGKKGLIAVLVVGGNNTLILVTLVLHDYAHSYHHIVTLCNSS
jgi:hypothetical protein